MVIFAEVHLSVPKLQFHICNPICWKSEAFNAGYKNDGYAIVQAIVAWYSAAEYTFNSVRPFDMIWAGH